MYEQICIKFGMKKMNLSLLELHLYARNKNNPVA